MSWLGARLIICCVSALAQLLNDMRFTMIHDTYASPSNATFVEDLVDIAFIV